jgi:hypothetical protein
LTTTAEASLAERALITIDPPAYVAAVFAPFRSALDDAVAACKNIAYDIQTADGMRVATLWRATFRTVRTDAEKERKARKAPILEIGRLLDSRCKEIEIEAQALEARFDRDIKAEEARKESARLEKIRAEQGRVLALQQRVSEIADRFTPGLNDASARIDGLLGELRGFEIGEDFEEFRSQAQGLKDKLLARLEQLLGERRRYEAEQAALAAERAELERQRAAQAARERELEAQAARAREQEVLAARLKSPDAQREAAAGKAAAPAAPAAAPAAHEYRMPVAANASPMPRAESAIGQAPLAPPSIPPDGIELLREFIEGYSSVPAFQVVAMHIRDFLENYEPQ